MESKFKERFKLLRAENNLSQSKIANILNVGRQTVVNWETRGSEPDYNTLIKIANYFKVTTDYLLGVVDDIQ